MNLINILLVDDSKADIFMTKRAFKEGKVVNNIKTAENGEEALNYLQDPDIENPDIILLDINMPRMNGLELLKIIKEDTNLKLIPVIMLTTSINEVDIINSYAHHANSYITKPVNLSDFSEAIRKFEDYWTSFVKLPKAHN
jgi:CheY-like chemotaxis protein